jgi:MFS family permease
VRQLISVLTRYRDFRKLFAAELVMFGGDWFVLVPLLTLLPRLTGSGAWGAVVLAADTGTIALLLPFTGTVADRLDRRKIMIVATLAGLLAVLALLLVRTRETAWVAPAAVAALAVAKAFYMPAVSAALPNMVEREDLAAANALTSSTWGTMAVVAASLGGLLTAVAGPYACFGITAGCLALAALLAWRIKRPTQVEREGAPTRTWGAIAEAMRYIVRRPRVASLVTVKSAVGLGNGVLTVFPLLATVVYHVGSAGTGLLFGARGLGALLGPLLLRRVLAHRSWLLRGLALSMGAYGLMYLLVAATPWFWLAVLLIVVAHGAGGGNWAMSNFALQTEVPDTLRGRVFATDVMFATLAISISQLVVGAFVDRISPQLLIICCGATTLTYSVIWRLLTLRLVRDNDPDRSSRAPAAALDG